MNLGPATVNSTYQYLLNQSGTNITLGNNGAVNWNGANVVTRTGNQTIAGTKTFSSNIFSAGFGVGASSNLFGFSSTNNSFGDYSMSNTFGESVSTQNAFGNSADINYFGDYATTSNSFGNGAASNTFGDYATSSNSFGDSSPSNSFGNFGSSNSFGVNAVSNSFGLGAANTIGESSFAGIVTLLLPQFSGSSSQFGQFGELRVSGSGLYVCTGTAGGWRRIFLQSF